MRRSITIAVGYNIYLQKLLCVQLITKIYFSFEADVLRTLGPYIYASFSWWLIRVGLIFSLCPHIHVYIFSKDEHVTNLINMLQILNTNNDVILLPLKLTGLNHPYHWYTIWCWYDIMWRNSTCAVAYKQYVSWYTMYILYARHTSSLSFPFYKFILGLTDL